MIRLIFVTGSALRKVMINGRIITMMSAETNFAPLKIDLNKIEKSRKLKKKLGEESYQLLKEIASLKNEKDYARDIIEDFQRTGWRLVKRE